MADYREPFTKYLSDTLGVAVSLWEWPGKSRLPLFLRQAYDFHEFEFLGQPCLTMVETGNEDLSPATIRKQMAQLRDKFPGEVIYVRLGLTSDLRRRLIEQGVQFVIPGNQLYLPRFGLDLREYFRTRPSESDVLTPAAQATLLYLLLHEDATNRSVNGLARPLGYSKMSISRAFTELEIPQLGKVETMGRNRFLHLADEPKVVWQAAQKHLRSPVRDRVMFEDFGNRDLGVTAGLPALSKYTMLSAGSRPTYAVSASDWEEGTGHSLGATGEQHEVEIELWTYDPRLLARDGLVDRLSLFLSLRESEDERVQAALSEMIESMPW
jgi:hypothetical protein